MLVLATVLLALLASPESAYGSQDDELFGDVIAGTCLPATASGFDPLTNQSVCRGRQVLQGDVRGVLRYTFSGHVDPITGNAEGTLVSRGMLYWRDGGGFVKLRGPATVDGATGAELVHLNEVFAVGAFAGKHLVLDLQGVAPLTGGPAQGFYTGQITNR